MLLPIPEGDNGEQRLENLGLTLIQEGDRTLVDMVTYGSLAAEAGLDFDQEILDVRAPVERQRKEWMWLPALLLLALVAGLQWRRKEARETLSGGQARSL